MDRRELLGGRGGEAEVSRLVRAREDIRRRYFPDVVLRTHLGRKVRFYEDCVRDRIVTINFMYVACTDGTCPVTSFALSRIQKLLAPRVGRDVFMYSITLNPEYDTLPILADYAKGFDAGPGWMFLRAEPADTDLLRRRLGFYDRNPELDRDKANHAATIRFGNEPRCLWSMTRGQIDPEVAARSIRWVM